MQETIVSHESFFDIHFKCTANSITNIIKIHRCSWFYSPHLWHKKQIDISLFTFKRNGKVTSVVNFIPSMIWSLPQGVSKVVLYTDLNIERESLGDSRFVINSLLGCFKWSQRRYISCTSLILHVPFIEVCTQYQFKTICIVDALS